MKPDRARSGSRRRLAVLVAVNLLVLALLLEVAALAVYYVRRGSLYYLDRPEASAVETPPDATVEAYRLHPFLSFVVRPSELVGEEHAYNNYGFLSPSPYPSARRHPREVLVGIFGGSAAAHLATFEEREKVLAGALAEALGREADEVRVLNFAQGGYKQPQQVLIHDYFRALGQELDLVVNFDGFNEVVLAQRNAAQDVAVDMPSIEHVGALARATPAWADTEDLRKMLHLRAAVERYLAAHQRAWSGRGWELTFASGFLVDVLIERYWQHRYVRGRLALVYERGDGYGSWLYLNPAAPRAKGAAAGNDAALERAVRLWRRGSEILQANVHSTGGLYLHFVQPNQHYPTARVFTEEERRVAFHELSPYSDLVPEGYARLEREAVAAREDGLEVEGLFGLLDDLEEAAYADDCCHFTRPAQRRILEHVGRVAVERLAALVGGDEPAR